MTMITSPHHVRHILRRDGRETRCGHDAREWVHDRDCENCFPSPAPQQPASRQQLALDLPPAPSPLALRQARRPTASLGPLGVVETCKQYGLTVPSKAATAHRRW